jgi:hypothetical protein
MAYGEIVSDIVGAGLVGAVVAVSNILAGLLLIGIYVYLSLAWYTIAKKLKYRDAWLAWLPIIHIVLILQLGGFHWAWIFLIFIPIVGWLALLIILIIATWRIFERLNQPGWFSLSLIIPQVGFLLYLIAIGLVAWGGENKVEKIKVRHKKGAARKIKKK